MNNAEIELPRKKRISKEPAVLLLLIGICSILLATGISFAFFTAGLSGNEETQTIILRTGQLRITYLNESTINAQYIFPGPEAIGTKHFSVVGNNNIALIIPYFINLHVTNNSFSDHAIEYLLIGTEGSEGGTLAPNIIYLRGIPTGTGEYTLGGGSFGRGQDITHNYTLSFFFRDIPNVNQNIDHGASFQAFVNIPNYAVEN
jgi:hypothetical protein